MADANNFEYCLNTSTIRECGLGLEEEIRLAAQAGYQGIEIWDSEIFEYIKQGGTVNTLKSLLEENQLRVPNVIAFFHWAHPDSSVRAKALEEALAMAQIARSIGCPYIAAPPAGIADRTDLPLKEIAVYYGELLGAFQGSGVLPLLEFWGHARILRSIHEALQILSIIQNPEAVLLADVFHMAKTQGSFELLAELESTRLALFHINDYPDVQDISTLADSERLYPGDGVAPMGSILTKLRQIGYAGMLSLELFNKTYQQAGAENVVREGLEKMQAVVAASLAEQQL